MSNRWSANSWPVPVLVENLETALRLASTGTTGGQLSPKGARYQFVTLAGEVITREGIVQGGISKEATGSSVLQRKTQIADLQVEAQTIRANLVDLTNRRNDGANRLEAAQQRLQEARDDSQTLTLNLSHLRGQLGTIERDLKETRRKVESFGAERDSIERKHDEAIAKLSQLEEEAFAAASQITDLKRNKATCRNH